MTKNETTNERPTDYSKWHREQLPGDCMMIDLDSVEIRKIDKEFKPVALIEVGRWDRSKFTNIQQQIVKHISNKLRIPSYFVEYYIDSKNNQNNKFLVTELDTDIKTSYTNEEYKYFIMSLKQELDNWM